MARPTLREKPPVSAALVELRAQLGITQAQLAAMLGVALATVGRWETSNPPNGPSLIRLVAFAEKQHCSAWAKAMYQEPPPKSWPTPREQAKALYEQLRDFIHEMKDAGMNDWDMDRAIVHGRLNYQKARRESAIERDEG